jgi:hypothetical protein
MEQLATPSNELISRILQEVDFTDRLSGGLLHQRAGVTIMALYSFAEVCALLNKPYPQIDVQQLEQWIRTVIKDTELADRINAVHSQQGSDRDKLLSLRDLLGLRLMQCRKRDATAIDSEPAVS